MAFNVYSPGRNRTCYSVMVLPVEKENNDETNSKTGNIYIQYLCTYTARAIVNENTYIQHIKVGFLEIFIEMCTLI